jgi:hypothetical protein
VDEHASGWSHGSLPGRGTHRVRSRTTTSPPTVLADATAREVAAGKQVEINPSGLRDDPVDVATDERDRIDDDAIAALRAANLKLSEMVARHDVRALLRARTRSPAASPAMAFRRPTR